MEQAIDNLLATADQGWFRWRSARGFELAGILAKEMTSGPSAHRFAWFLRRRVSRRDLALCHEAILGAITQGLGSLQLDIRLSGAGAAGLRRITFHFAYDEAGRLESLSGLLSPALESPAAGSAPDIDRLLRLFFEHSPLSMFIKDIAGRYLLINAQAESLFSASNQLVQGQPVDAFYPAELAAAVHADDSRVLQSDEIVRHEWLIPAGAEQRWFAAAKFAIRDETGQAVGIGGVDADIHEQKRLEAALREASMLLRAVIDAVPAVIAVRDTNGRFVLVNRALADLIGLEPDDCVGKTPVELGGWDVTQRLLGLQAPMSAEGQWGKFCEVETSRIGEPKVWLSNSVPVRAGTGSVSHIVSVAIDITMRKRAEEALLAAKELAERANFAKSSFLAAASHDLRQPLQALGLFVTALERRVRSGTGRAILRDMQDCLGSMGSLLNALLDISQLEAGTIAPKPGNLGLQQIFELLLREHRPTALQKGLALRMVASKAVVRSDPVLLRTILANLLANAIRYTPSGRILLGCRRLSGNRLSIEVHDTGIGIPEDQTARIFEDFYQVSSTATDRSRGLGLGLAIARRLATLLGHEVGGHEIGVRSRPGRGSTFTLSVPLGVEEFAANEVEPAQVGRRSLANRRMLILENDPAVSSALATLLCDWGAVPIEAATLEAALASLASSPPDVVIADYQLDRGETGLAGLAIIEERLRRRIPAIILSGDMAPEDLRRMRNSGYYTLSKPAQPGRLRALLDICLAG